MGKLLGKNDILKAKDLETEEVAVPEWGGAVRVKAMTGAERNTYEQSVLVKHGETIETNLQLAKEKLLVITLVDEANERLFSDKDVAEIAAKNAAVIDRLFSVSARLSGISGQDVDELEKNSVGVQSDGSGSD